MEREVITENYALYEGDSIEKMKKDYTKVWQICL